MAFLFFGALLGILAFCIRIRPRIFQRNFGIDSWYFLLCADELRKRKKIPIKLPYFLLDIDEQWYPPVLPILLTFFPQRFLEKFHWAISAFIDAVQMIVLYLLSYFLTKSLLVASLAALLYATSPILVTQNSNLNSRALGSLILSLIMLSLYGYISISSPLYLIFTILFGALLLHTHKLASQQLLFLFVGFSIFYFNPIYILILLGIFLTAIILSLGFYLKIFRGHIGILKFWKKNLPFLGAHQIYDSPIYRDEEKAKSKRGSRGIMADKLWFDLAKFQFLFLFMVISFYIFINRRTLSLFDTFFLNWFLVSFLSVVVINYCPPLKFLGEGYRYFTYGVFPAALLLPCLIFSSEKIYIGVVFLSIFFIINLLLIKKIYTEQKKNILAAINADLYMMIDHIKDLPRDNIMCFPFSHCEHIAYFCRKKTLWGAHSCGYDKLQPFFPILSKPIEYFIHSYAVSYCLLNKDYVSLEVLRLSVAHKIIRNNGSYCLIELLAT